MGVIQPIVFCAFLGEPWDPDDFLGVIKAQLQKADPKALPVIVGPEFMFARFDDNRKIAPLLPNDPKLELLMELGELSSTGALVIPGTTVTRSGRGLRNSTSIFHRGQLLHQVDKLHQGTPAEPAQWDKQVQPAEDPADHPDTFVLRYGDGSETRFGVEICTDKGSMKEFLRSHGRAIGKWPEVYIQTSYGMSLSNFLTWNRDRRAFQYRTLDNRNIVQWKQARYTFDIQEDPKLYELDEFALHKTTPGMFIQSDGHLCRVGYKFPMRQCYTFVPPLESVEVTGARRILEGCTLSVHRFPPVKLDLLNPYWV